MKHENKKCTRKVFWSSRISSIFFAENIFPMLLLRHYGTQHSATIRGPVYNGARGTTTVLAPTQLSVNYLPAGTSLVPEVKRSLLHTLYNSMDKMLQMSKSKVTKDTQDIYCESTAKFFFAASRRPAIFFCWKYFFRCLHYGTRHPATIQGWLTPAALPCVSSAFGA